MIRSKTDCFNSNKFTNSVNQRHNTGRKIFPRFFPTAFRKDDQLKINKKFYYRSLFSLLCLLFLLFESSSSAAQPSLSIPLVPVSVSGESKTHLIANAIDRNYNTYTCLLDDSPNGSNTQMIPANGDSPVTGHAVFKFNEPYFIYAVKITAPKNNFYAPKNLDLFYLKPDSDLSNPPGQNDWKNDRNLLSILKNEDLAYFANGQSILIPFKGVAAQYLGLRFNDAFETGRMNYAIIQFSEIEVFGVPVSQASAIDLNSITIDGKSYKDLMAEKDLLRNRNTIPYPQSRLELSWMRQDYGQLEVSSCFQGAQNFLLEKEMIRKVLNEIAQDEEIPELEKEFAQLIEKDPQAGDPSVWEFYKKACQKRRDLRLQSVRDYSAEYIYVKHCQLQNQPSFASSAFLSDSVYKDRLGDWRTGSELCKMSIDDSGKIKTELLLRQPNGIIRDPCVSFDGKKIIFSQRISEQDDYHLYEMDLASRKVRQLTFGPGTADIEPCLLPNGDIIFTSTRCDQNVPCWSSDVTNIYRCDSEGRYIRRLGFDQAHLVYPTLTEDGRIVFTRWEYNDRVSGYCHKLFIMNPDGTAQTEFYGNESFAPRSIIHARSIPGTSKMMVIGSGHHTYQVGKLMRLDRTRGTQEAEGLEYVAPVKKFHPVRDDLFGSEGELFQYPLPIDEDNYLVSYVPEGNPGRGGRNQRPFSIYWMNSDGRRELLIHDPSISSGQIVPLAKRTPPPIRPNAFDLNKKDGNFYVQDIYYGPGLKNVPRGTIKKIRVIGISYRAMSAGVDYDQPSAQKHTPIGIGNSSWDVKHVLGDVDVETDGSAFFKVPARMAVYFQMLDEKGRMVQSMRSWAMVLPGETFACIGCHEDKNTTFTSKKLSTIAGKRPPQEIQPFYEPGEIALQEQIQFMSESEKRACEYLNINAPQGMDVPQGFSYLREIQPIWDQHCVCCHTGRQNADGKRMPMSLLGDTGEYTWSQAWKDVKSRPWSLQNIYPQTGKDMNPGRDFAESYLRLTNWGRVCYGHQSQWINWIPMAISFPPLLPPYYWGSTKSALMNYLEPSHYSVKLSDREKKRIACWIDLCVPYCGSYMEANKWDKIEHTYIHSYRKDCRPAYLFQEAKRLKHAEMEVVHLDKYKKHLENNMQFKPEEFPQFTFGGTDNQKKFIDSYNNRSSEVPIYGIAEGKNARGGSNVKNIYRNLALNPKASVFSLRSYPRAVSNSHFKYLYEFAPTNVINGSINDEKYWKPNRRTDLWLTIEFGREIETDKAVLVLKLAPNQKKTWRKALLEFSDGSKQEIELKNTSDPQSFVFSKRKTSYVKLTDLCEHFPISENAIDEFEIWGRDL